MGKIDDRAVVLGASIAGGCWRGRAGHKSPMFIAEFGLLNMASQHGVVGREPSVVANEHTACAIYRNRYSWHVGERWRVVFSAEVTRWYEALSTRELAQADQALDRLAAEGLALPMPHNRYLSDKLWELRFRCGQVNQRITYTVDPNRRIITLTTFRKQRDNERLEIRRARNALRKHRQQEGQS